MVAGSDTLGIISGYHLVRIELVSGGRTRLDYISIDLLPNAGITDPVNQESTWSSIKALYR